MSAATASGARRSTARRAEPARATANRAATRRSASPRLPRRISGPVGGRAGAYAAPHRSPTVGARALAVVRSLPDRSLIDRLVRGRAWIPVLGVLLTGIVAMQVEILKLGTSMGRSLERTTALQTRNDSLQASVAALSNDQRIERLAAGMGMVLPTPGLLTFVPAQPGSQLGRALANIHAPDPTGFASQLAAQVAAAAALTGSTTTTGSNPSTTTTGAGSTGATTVATSSTTAGSAVGGATSTATTSSQGTGTSTTPTSSQSTNTTGSQSTVAANASQGPATTSSGAAGLAPPSTSQSGSPSGG